MARCLNIEVFDRKAMKFSETLAGGVDVIMVDLTKKPFKDEVLCTIPPERRSLIAAFLSDYLPLKP